MEGGMGAQSSPAGAAGLVHAPPFRVAFSPMEGGMGAQSSPAGAAGLVHAPP